MKNINDLSPEIVPIVWIALKTGLRISDVLGLRKDCLKKINNKYWVQTDIEKTFVKDHRIPIDNELALIIASLIDKSGKLSNQREQSLNYIFVCYHGTGKGILCLKSRLHFI
ncbi:tyrosine-type recombinase/integrase [Enterococcus malodoratus]|uniref:tyrosine-type recombinase/integrase n=1 Tax=Enterococcus malodoratus TaxID=71451 RepID=UPI001C66B3D6|nr:tyrosine-type recombinase/integrase [Enterococcus malodoratus]